MRKQKFNFNLPSCFWPWYFKQKTAEWDLISFYLFCVVGNQKIWHKFRHWELASDLYSRYDVLHCFKTLPSFLNPLCLQPCKLKQDFEMGLNFELGIRRGQKQAEIKSPGVYNWPDLSKTTIFIFGRFYIIDFCMIFPLMLWTPPKDRFLHNRLASFTRLTKTYDTFN